MKKLSTFKITHPFAKTDIAGLNVLICIAQSFGRAERIVVIEIRSVVSPLANQTLPLGIISHYSRSLCFYYNIFAIIVKVDGRSACGHSWGSII
ncbi:hypothetical protein H5T87_07530 [bacterium]|nr:hypothetical protein [bacterium]